MERELMETSRAMSQTISRLQREVATLRRRSGWTGTAIRERLSAPAAALTGGAETTLVEFDVAPGRWYLSYRAAMTVTVANFTGSEEATLCMSTRSPGASLSDQVMVDEILSGSHGSTPAGLAVIGRAEYPLSGFETVASDAGLTVRLYGIARDPAGTPRPVSWRAALMVALPL
jgi:hypothetical protein